MEILVCVPNVSLFVVQFPFCFKIVALISYFFVLHALSVPPEITVLPLQ